MLPELLKIQNFTEFQMNSKWHCSWILGGAGKKPGPKPGPNPVRTRLLSPLVEVLVAVVGPSPERGEGKIHANFGFSRHMHQYASRSTVGLISVFRVTCIGNASRSTVGLYIGLNKSAQKFCRNLSTQLSQCLAWISRTIKIYQNI